MLPLLSNWYLTIFFSLSHSEQHIIERTPTWLSTYWLRLVDLENIVLEYWKTDTPFADEHDLTAATVKSFITEPDLRDFIYRDYKSLDRQDYRIIWAHVIGQFSTPL